MQDTLKNLRLIITEDSYKLTIEQLSEKYKKTRDPTYLATAFEKVFKLTIKLSQKYYGLASQDIASFALEKLDYCLLNYEESKNIKFITYFYTILQNKFREETQYLNLQKNKLNYLCTSYEFCLENGYDKSVLNVIEEDIQFKNLSEKEIEYCKLLVLEYSNLEISKLLDVSLMTLCNWRKKLRQKLYKSDIFNI